MNFATIGQNIVKLTVKYWYKFLITGLGYTLSLAAITVAVGAILGSLIALLRMSKFPPFRWISAIYTEIIRGTPMLLQLYLFYFALPQLIPFLNKKQYLCVAIALVCNSAAYVSEIIRSGIQAVDAGQTEAARSLGLSQGLTMTQIILPQAIPHVLPAYRGEIVGLIKATAIVGYIAVQDLTKMGDIVRSRTYEAFFPLIAVTVIYFVLEGLFSFAVSRIRIRIDPKQRSRERILKGVDLSQSL